MPKHRKPNHDLDELFSSVQFEPDAQFEKRLMARLRQSASSGALPSSPNGQRTPPAKGRDRDYRPPSDEEDRSMKGSRFNLLLGFGLTGALAVAVIVLIFMLPPRPAPIEADEPTAGPTLDPTTPPDTPTATQTPTEAPTATATIRPMNTAIPTATLMEGQRIVTDPADLVGNWATDPQAFPRDNMQTVYLNLFLAFHEDGTFLLGAADVDQWNGLFPPEGGPFLCLAGTYLLHDNLIQWKESQSLSTCNTPNGSVVLYEARRGQDSDGLETLSFITIEDANPFRPGKFLPTYNWKRCEANAACPVSREP